MRTLALLSWLMIPVLVGAYHYGPGQDRLRLDDVSTVLSQAERQAADEDYAAAVRTYEQALTMLPADRVAESRRVRLERAKAQMLARLLPEANADLTTLVDEISSDNSPDPKLLADAREVLANSQYYLTWLMRLEGLPRAEWEPLIEGARQTYRLLAQQAEDQGDAKALERHEEDLESAIRLARMEPGDLQGLAIPKQCQNCKSGQCKNRGRKPGRKPSNSKEKKDARGASSGPPPDNAGS